MVKTAKQEGKLFEDLKRKESFMMYSITGLTAWPSG